MSDYREQINTHYGRQDLTESILQALSDNGVDADHPTRDDLTGLDEFHIGGRSETRELARVAGITAGMRVLDVGAGLGGPARTLAAEFDCEVVGIDLTDEYVRAADTLTERVGLSDRVHFKAADATDLPFEDDTFDIVWLQFVNMNVSDKEAMLREFRRVLKPGGKVALHEVFAGNGEPLDYPVFWATEDNLSYLISADEFRGLLDGAGFRPVVWTDISERALLTFERFQATPPAERPPLNLSVIVGRDAARRAKNVTENLRHGRIVVTQAVYSNSST